MATDTIQNILVSIRSPHRSKGRPILTPPQRQGHRFQSAPLTEARGDEAIDVAVTQPLTFQSAPLTEARGDLSMGDVSTLDKWSFNPLPSPKQGETVQPDKGSITGCSFNPLPSPKQGETKGVITNCQVYLLFQSAPLTEARGDRVISFEHVAM